MTNALSDLSRCPLGDDCDAWPPTYPDSYRDPRPRPGEGDFEYWGRVFAARGEALRGSFNAHLAGHAGFEGLRFEWKAA